MLANIKSAYILKIIFEYISEIPTMKLIRYNKIFQKKLDFNIFKYIEKSGRYIIYEQGKKKGKEYNSYSDALLYEGEYLNELKNGKGKEYYPDGKLKFDGEYLNGKRNGEGRE
jgi:antitoxin component YwqK of YwqJK toxin-antitoxin module